MSKARIKDTEDQVTRDAVRLAYRLILGREPESEVVVDEKVASITTIEELRRDLMSSPEFTDRNSKVPTVCVSGLEPPLPVELDVDQNRLNLLFDRVKQTWTDLGEQAPYWSVWTDERFSGSDLGDLKSEFFESGRVHLNYLRNTLERNRLNTGHLKTCLEIGCGVGRFTPFLAEFSDIVYAADVSPSHMSIARSVVTDAKIENVRFLLLGDMQAFHALPKVDLVYSMVVLQHNPPPLIQWMLHRMLDAVSEGGVAYFQVPTYCSGYRFDFEEYMNMSSDAQIEMHMIPQSRVFEIAKHHLCDVVEVIEDGWTIPEIGSRSNTFVVSKRGQ